VLAVDYGTSPGPSSASCPSDMRTALVSITQMVLAALVAAVVSVVALAAIARVQWPAFPSSNQLHAPTVVSAEPLPLRSGGTATAPHPKTWSLPPRATQ